MIVFPMNAENEFDSSMLDELRSMMPDDPSLVNDLIDTYLNDVPQRLAELQDALSPPDADRLHRASHTLKGSSSNMGLKAVMSLSAELCNKTRQGDVSGAEDLVASIIAASERAEHILAEQRSSIA